MTASTSQDAPAATRPPAPTGAAGWLSRISREACILFIGWALYTAGRFVAGGREELAYENARKVWSLERMLRLPDEAAIQAAAMKVPHLVEIANGYYAAVHFPLTIAVLVWLYRYRRPAYHWAKRALLGATTVALVFTVLLPVTPPRLLTSLGMVDTGHAGGISIYQAPVLGSMSNEYAAMPSLHVGWALLIAVVLIAACRTRWRWLWLLHPLATVFVVVSTANHYWLDGIAGSVLVLGALWLTRPRVLGRRVVGG